MHVKTHSPRKMAALRTKEGININTIIESSDQTNIDSFNLCKLPQMTKTLNEHTMETIVNVE